MAKPGVPFSKGRRVCIFCGGTPATEEHIWPQWAHPILPETKTHYRMTFAVNKRENTTHSVKERNRQGSVATIRMKRVCGPCNSGWMGTHEEMIRPILERMIVGEEVWLTADDQALLAQYLSYKMMIADWETEEPIVAEEHRLRFYEDRTIPPNTQICLFRCYEGRAQIYMFGQGVGLWLENDGPRPAGFVNAKSFAIGLGDMFAFVFMGPDVEAFPFVRFKPGISIQICPSAHAPLRWPPPISISSAAAQEVAECIWRIDEFPGFKLGD